MLMEAIMEGCAVCLGQIDYRDNLLRSVLSAIRKCKTSTPVLFLSGHSNTKGFLRFDDDASGVEVGSNFELGWVTSSFDKIVRHM
jgi:hypothetical protein